MSARNNEQLNKNCASPYLVEAQEIDRLLRKENFFDTLQEENRELKNELEQYKNILMIEMYRRARSAQAWLEYHERDDRDMIEDSYFRDMSRFNKLLGGVKWNLRESKKKD